VEGSSGKQSAQRKSQPSLQKEAHRIHYIHIVIQAELEGHAPPPLPRKAKANWQSVIDGKGGPLAWAKTQPEYASLREKKVRKKGAKGELRQSIDENPKSTEQNDGPDQEIDGHLIVIRAALAQISFLMEQVTNRQAKIELLVNGRWTCNGGGA